MASAAQKLVKMVINAFDKLVQRLANLAKNILKRCRSIQRRIVNRRAKEICETMIENPHLMVTHTRHASAVRGNGKVHVYVKNPRRFVGTFSEEYIKENL